MLKRNLAAALIGNTVFSGAQWLTTVAIARLGTQQMVGEFALGLAVATPLFAATGLQLRALLATDSTERFSFAQFLRLRVIGSAMALILIGAFSFYSWPMGTALAVCAVGTRAFVDSFSDVYYGRAQQRNRLDIVGWLLCLRGVTGILAIGVVLWFTPRLPFAVLACTAVWAAILFLVERPAIGNAFPDGCKLPASTRDLLQAGIPLAAVLFLLNGSQSVPRLLLQHTAGPAALGVFAAAAMVSAAMGLLFGSVAQTILPLLAEQFVSQRSAYRRTLTLALCACALGAAFCIALAVLFGPTIMRVVFGAAYRSGAGVLGFLLVASALSNVAMILGAGATAARRYGPQLVASALTFIVALIAASVAVPKWGLSGAAAALVISGIAQVVAYAIICFAATKSMPHMDHVVGRVSIRAGSCEMTATVSKERLMAERIRYGVLIVNYNSAHHVSRAVESVLRHASTGDVRIQIVDNASEAKDRQDLRSLAGPQVFVDELHSNLGFARGNNEAVRLLEARYTPDYLVFMNPDVEISSSGTIEGLIAAIVSSGPNIVGSQPLVWDPRKPQAPEDQINIRRVPRYWDLIVAESQLLRPIFPDSFARLTMADFKPYRERVRFQVPSGAFFVIERKAFHEVGGFDARTFLYGEELFLGAKLKSRGWQFVLDPDLRVVHIQGSSTGFSRRFPRRSMFNHHRRSVCLFATSELGCSRMASALLRAAMELGFACRLTHFALDRADRLWQQHKPHLLRRASSAKEQR